jgi:hypothetical protein
MTQIQMTPPPYLSASLISSFDSCPFRYAKSKYQGAKENADGARFGSLFHQTIEEIDGLAAPDVYEKVVSIFGEEEASEVIDYIQDIQFSDNLAGLKRIARETKFEILMPEIGITLVGHIDDLLESEDGSTLVIRDYKTTLKFEPAVVWSNRVQPRCYNYAVRRLSNLKKYDNYVFQICYPKQGKVVEWDLEPENESFEDYISNVWLKMKEYYGKGFDEGEPSKYFPQILNDNCRYCVVRNQCDKYQKAIKLTMIPTAEIDESDGEKYVRLNSLSKAIDTEIALIKERLLKRFQPGERSLDDNGYAFRLQSNSRRRYVAGDILHELEVKGVLESYDIDLNKLLEVSSSEIDSLSRKYPELRDLFDRYKTVKSGAPFLIFSGSKGKK